MRKKSIRVIAMATIVALIGTCFVGCKKDKCENCGSTKNVKMVEVSYDEIMMLCSDCKVCDLCGEVAECEVVEIFGVEINVCDDCE